MSTLLKLKKSCRNNAINNATASGFNSLAVAWLYISYFPALPEPPPALPEFPPGDAPLDAPLLMISSSLT